MSSALAAVRRFADRDVREDPSLRELAVRYAAGYTGDWEVMVDAQQLVARTGTLPVPVARLVLNVMRADARYADKIRGPQPADVDLDLPPAKPKLHVVPDPPKHERRLTLDMPAMIKAPYGIAGQMQPARATIHRVSRGVVEWVFPYVRDGCNFEREDVRVPVLGVHFICKPRWNTYKNPRLFMSLRDAIEYGTEAGCRSGCWGITRTRSGFIPAHDGSEQTIEQALEAEEASCSSE